MHERIAAVAPSSLDPQTVETLRDAAFDTLLLTSTDGTPGDATSRVEGFAWWVVVLPDADGAPAFDDGAVPPVDPWMIDDEVALDPRRKPTAVRPGPVADADAVLPAWQQALARAAASGAAGFVCRDVDRLPATFWSALIASMRADQPALRWVAWTAGSAPDEVEALVANGFDTVCNSVAWWNGRAHWLAAEARRAPSAQRLAFPVDPFGPALADDPMTLEQRLRLAAVTGDALLVPEAVWREVDCGPVNRWLASRGGDRAPGGVRFVSGEDAPVTVLVKSPRFDLRAVDDVLVAVLNPDARRRACLAATAVTTALSGFGRFDELFGPGARSAKLPIDPCSTIELDPGELRIFEARRLPPIRLPVPNPKRSAETAIALPRIAIEAITPSVDGGRFPVKRIAGESVRVEADILIDGHEKLAAAVLYRAAGDRDWREVPHGAARERPLRRELPADARRSPRVHDRGVARRLREYRNELDKKFAAGLDVSLELIEGRKLVEDAVANATTAKRGDVAKRLTAVLRAVSSDVAGDRATMAAQVAALLGSQTLADLYRADRREFATRPDVVFPVDAERSAASFAAWYELFPRSLGNPPGAPATHHGTFDDVIDRLPAVRAMGFDVLYFPPIHPIGRRNRKGRNNSLVAGDDDPGSPYAIGSPDGGHDALHPGLGTFDDFRRLRDAALANGLELALDFAIQCSPDHPWLKDHPGWFAWRPDGSLRYAENPPKKYEDIVNVDFYTAAKGGDAASALWTALRDVVLLWVDQGVKIFRVDNPHTKPLPFWEWMIGEVRAQSSGHDLPVGGVHAAEGDVPAREGRLLAVVHVLHVAPHEAGVHRLPDRTHRARVARGAAHRAARLLPSELLRQHAGHQSGLPAALRSRGLPDPGRARGDPVGAVGRLQRLRAVRGDAGAGQGGLSGQREVPAARVGLAVVRATSSPRSPRSTASATRIRRCARTSTSASKTHSTRTFSILRSPPRIAATSCWSPSTSTRTARTRPTSSCRCGAGACPTTRPSTRRTCSTAGASAGSASASGCGSIPVSTRMRCGA